MPVGKINLRAEAERPTRPIVLTLALPPGAPWRLRLTRIRLGDGSNDQCANWYRSGGPAERPSKVYVL